MTTLMATGVGPDGTKVWNPTAFTKGFCGYSKTVKCAVRNEGTKLCECDENRAPVDWPAPPIIWPEPAGPATPLDPNETEAFPL